MKSEPEGAWESITSVLPTVLPKTFPQEEADVSGLLNKIKSKIYILQKELSILERTITQGPRRRKAEGDEKGEPTGKKALEKWWKNTSRAKKILDVVDVASETLGLFSGVKDVIETITPDPALLKLDNIISTLTNLNNEVYLSKDKENPSIKKTVKSLGPSLTQKLDDFKLNFLIRDILTNFLLDLRTYISKLTDSLFASTKWTNQDVLHRIHEILYEKNDDVINIINNKLLPPIKSINYFSEENKSLCFIFGFDDCSEDHIFSILQPTVEKRIIDILISCLGTQTEGDLVNIGPLVGSSVQIESGSYALNLDQLGFFDFALLYVQLINVNTEGINNIITAFNYNGSVDNPKFDKCNLCAK